MPLVAEMEKAIINSDPTTILAIIKEGWEKKKEISPAAIGQKKVKDLDIALSLDKNIHAHRLCGAGGGGFFLALAKHHWKPSKLDIEKQTVKINISKMGASAQQL